MWLHVSTNYTVILRPLVYIKPKLRLKILFWVKMRSHYVVQCVQMEYNTKLFKHNLKVTD